MPYKHHFIFAIQALYLIREEIPCLVQRNTILRCEHSLTVFTLETMRYFKDNMKRSSQIQTVLYTDIILKYEFQGIKCNNRLQSKSILPCLSKLSSKWSDNHMQHFLLPGIQ